MKGIVAYNIKSEYYSLVCKDNGVGDRGFPLPPYHLAHSVSALWAFSLHSIANFILVCKNEIYLVN